MTRPSIVVAVGNRQLQAYFQQLHDDQVVRVAAVADSREQVLPMLQNCQPDLLILAYVLPGNVSLTDIARQARAASPKTRILWILHPHSADFQETCNAAIGAGYYDLFGNNVRTSQLREALFHPHRYEDVAHWHSDSDSEPQIEPSSPATEDIREKLQSVSSADPEAADRASTPVRSVSIAVWSPKGGSGSTTIATRLALHAAKQNFPAAIYDFNLPHAHVAYHYGILERNTGFEHLLNLEREIDWSVIYQSMHHFRGVRVFSGMPLHPELADQVSPSWLDLMFEHTREDFTVSIFDLHPDINQLPTFLALKRCSLILVVVTQDPAGLHEARKQLSLLKRLNIPARRMRLIINRYVPGIRDLSEQDIAEYLQMQVMATIPEQYKEMITQLRDQKATYPQKIYEEILRQLLGMPMQRKGVWPLRR